MVLGREKNGEKEGEGKLPLGRWLEERLLLDYRLELASTMGRSGAGQNMIGQGERGERRRKKDSGRVKREEKEMK